MESFHWLRDLFTTTDSVAHIALLYAIVIAVGVYLGKIKIGGVSLGVTFVLFAGIMAGHIGFTAPTPILTFVQDFGLILFVFMIGLQVGPGFFESFGTQGIKLNGLAAVAILLNIIVIHLLRHERQDEPAHDGWHALWRRDEHSRTWCCQRGPVDSIRQQRAPDSLSLRLCLPTRRRRHYPGYYNNKVRVPHQA